MIYPASLLISRSWNLSGIVARNLESVSGDQTTDGLFLLNELLDIKAAELNLIPYWQRQTLQLIQGQESYFIPNLYQVETFTFNIGTVRYPMNSLNRDQYFGSGRVDNITSIPFSWHLERGKGGSTIYVYYLPDQNYVANLSGKFALTDVNLFTDLLTLYDGFYISYLRYALAQYMCNEYNIDFSVNNLSKLTQMEKKLSYISPPDLTQKKVNYISGRTTLNWAQVNIGKGYYP